MMSPLQQQEQQQRQPEEQDPSSSIIMTPISSSLSLSDLERISNTTCNPFIMIPSSPSSVTSMGQDDDGDGNGNNGNGSESGDEKNKNNSSTKDCSSKEDSNRNRNCNCSPQHSQHNRQESRDDVYFFADLGTSTTTTTITAHQQQQEQQEQQKDEQYVSFRNNKASSRQHQQHCLPQKQPFFLLDWLDDLVPDHHDPQHLAKLFKSKPTPPQQYKNRNKNNNNNNVYRRSSSSASCPHVHQDHDQESQELSPLQRLFSHWNKTITGNATTNNNNKKASSSTSTSMPDLYHPSLVDASQDSYSPSSPMSSPSLATLPGPGTPKSSNRKQRLASNSGLPRPFYHHHDDDDQDDHHQDHDLNPVNLVKPTNLALQLEQAADTDTAHAADAANAVLKLQQLPPCPSMVSSTAQQQQQQQQRYRLRRAKRNAQKASIPIVQRSLCLAQTWNQKGLDLAAATATATADPNNVTHSWTRALQCWDNALEIYSTLLGPLHPHVANVQNNRGIALGKLQQTPQALQALHVALDIRQCALSRRRQQKQSQQQQSQQQDGDDDDCSSNASHDSSSSSTSTSSSPQQQQQHQGDADNVDPDSVLVVVSTLHNIANVHQEAGNYSQALQTLVQAKQTLWQQSPPPRDDDDNDDDDDERLNMSDSNSTDNAEKWHQSARLCAAMGSVYYQAQQWKDAREAYQDALHLYQELVVSVQEHPAQPQQQPQQLRDELFAVRADLEELDEWYFLQPSREGDEERAGRYSHEDDCDEQDNYDEDDDDLAAAASAPWYYGPPSEGASTCSTLRIREKNNVYRRRDVHDDEWRSSNLVRPISQQQYPR